jgi:hypothetical protein
MVIVPEWWTAFDQFCSETDADESEDLSINLSRLDDQAK